MSKHILRAAALAAALLPAWAIGATLSLDKAIELAERGYGVGHHLGRGCGAAEVADHGEIRIRPVHKTRATTHCKRPVVRICQCVIETMPAVVERLTPPAKV